MSVIPIKSFPQVAHNLFALRQRKSDPAMTGQQDSSHSQRLALDKDGPFSVHPAVNFMDSIPVGMSLPHAKATNAITIV
jgi:hypothetical protein